LIWKTNQDKLADIVAEIAPQCNHKIPDFEKNIQILVIAVTFLRLIFGGFEVIFVS